MASSRHCLYLSILFVLIAFTHSYTPFLSYEVLKAGRSNRRSLFEGEEITECPINMQKQNYTIITSKCKRPGYPASLCCEALLEFCCGFVDEVNDMSTNCAEMMFYYINRYGKYPVGLFFNKCKEGPEGLSCQKVLQAQA